MNWIDSHCHLDYEPMSKDIEKVMSNMKNHDVIGAMSISTTTNTLDKSYAYLRDNIWFSVGVHPLDDKIGQVNEIDNYLTKWIGKKNIIAIGEAGLDSFKGSDINKQIPGFEVQLVHAEKHDLPLVLHMREAEDLTLDLLRKYNVRGIGHCYTGTLEFAKNILDLGWMISFSGIITFKNAEHVREVARFVPLDRILIETDSPYLAPAPYRGKSNEPAYVSHVGKYIAELKGIDENEFANITTTNFYNFMRINALDRKI
ncbi:TatD family hydrolase [Candidatus Cytomitobacter primus]|uniref:TatD family deoxyribonuclease n=1 Tax=Candidatus Cytomitobacter primus TaxID=2066024 RepID=A0A5C0UHI0_9PROT|nr:TatD family hydrolase [Candidatus Cytomitobacter primus]QEK38792.1 TatD family deoxyribonuclease [Candidatus Cytomitobacter primus]